MGKPLILAKNSDQTTGPHFRLHPPPGAASSMLQTLGQCQRAMDESMNQQVKKCPGSRETARRKGALKYLFARLPPKRRKTWTVLNLYNFVIEIWKLIKT